MNINKNTVVSAYMDGLKDARAMLKISPNIDKKKEYRNFESLVISSKGAFKDFCEGQRDFWENQCKKV